MLKAGEERGGREREREREREIHSSRGWWIASITEYHPSIRPPPICALISSHQHGMK
jgi:hypothetical protein